MAEPTGKGAQQAPSRGDRESFVGSQPSSTNRNEPNPDRVARYRRGQWAERLVTAVLMLKGYRILARRLRTPFGEIDIIARRGKRLAFVEVKQRATREAVEASITPRQQERIARAAAYWVSKRPLYQEHEQGLDLVFVTPWTWPQHIQNAFAPRRSW